jgi:hypothetical protein
MLLEVWLKEPVFLTTDQASDTVSEISREVWVFLWLNIEKYCLHFFPRVKKNTEMFHLKWVGHTCELLQDENYEKESLQHIS